MLGEFVFAMIWVYWETSSIPPDVSEIAAPRVLTPEPGETQQYHESSKHQS